MCKVGYFNCNLPCQNPRPHLCLPPHLPQGRSLSEWWLQGKVDAPRIVFSCFFCQWGDCDFLHHLDGRRGQGDHLDPCLTRPVLDLCTCGHFVLKVSGWNRVACLKIDGLEWHYISFILFARYLQLSIRIHENDSSPVYTWQLLEAGLCTQGHRNLSDRHYHCYKFRFYQIRSVYVWSSV